MKQPVTFDFWYAVNNTEVIRMPSRHLETFGATVLNYHMVCELMDTVSQIRVRTGRMQASRPEIITPEAYSQTLLEGFGEEAGQYVDWLKQHEKQVRILQYGYKLKQESFSEHVVTDNLKAVVERIKSEVNASSDPMSAVLIGVDKPWDVCLIKLFWEVIRSSAKPNIMEMEKHSLFEYSKLSPNLRHDIETAFIAANRNPALIKDLAALLDKHSAFDEYQDRFFSLVKMSGK
ncbi:MAG: hypothetical protein C0404_00315 [Verrucomicrobia bacterium]|nr:hypothetical protein [Verrucomicrobiota bacterium]